MPDIWLPTKQAAQYLSISEKTLKRRRDTHGGFLSNGKHYRYSTDAPNSSILWEVESIKQEFNIRSIAARNNAHT